MNPIRITLPALALAAAFAAPPAAMAQAEPMAAGEPGGGPPPHAPRPHRGPGAFMPGDGLPPAFRRLELSEEQRDAAFRITHARVPAMREHAKSRQKAIDELRALAADERFDEARARAVAETLARAEAGMALLAAQSEHALLAILTPAQRQEMSEAARAAGRGGAAGGRRPAMP